jgi:hypothetical protein
MTKQSISNDAIPQASLQEQTEIDLIRAKLISAENRECTTLTAAEIKAEALNRLSIQKSE